MTRKEDRRLEDEDTIILDRSLDEMSDEEIDNLKNHLVDRAKKSPEKDYFKIFLEYNELQKEMDILFGLLEENAKQKKLGWELNESLLVNNVQSMIHEQKMMLEQIKELES